MAFRSLLLFALVAAAFAGPLSYPSQTCATQCEGRKHGYEIGKTYDYDLTTTVLTTIPGATEDLSSLKLTALAHVEALSECDLALRLEDVLLQEAEAAVERVQDFKYGLEQNTLRFGLSGGKVTDVCPEEAEPTWALNIKRAVLSSLQITMEDFQTPDTKSENDVVGECPVMYEPTGSTWSSYTVTKTKDLLSCSQPTYSNTVFQGMNYKVPSKVQSLPLLKSNHECQLEVATNGRIIKSTCEERHIFRPFSRDESGATTVITHSLIFKAESSGVRSGLNVNRRTDLLFEHVSDEEVLDGTQREVMSTLEQICEVTKNGIRPEVPGLFGDLVKGMRRLDLSTLTNIGRRANRLCDKAQSFFRDAVPTLGTSAAVGLMREMIREGQASDNEIDIWLASLAFIPKPDVDMLKEVKPLLDIPTIRRKSYLAVSTMVSSYCRHNDNCDNEPAVQDVINFFKNQLGRDCSGDREPVLMALKALGNTGHASQVISVLNNCMANEAATMEVRVAAVSAMRRMDCSADNTALLDILRSTYTDSELRINAYLALMRCPSESTLVIVKRLLESEEINQVGSFIWTHLTNLMETDSPLKQEVKAILANHKLQKEFDLDKRKFSRNIEWSAFNDAINTGAAVESNLIWSSQSFVPRSAMVNLTVDLFGHSVNLVEFGGRVQGLDAILENMFADSPESEMQSNKINNFDSSFHQGNTDPQGSYYIRVFGNEIKYEDFAGFDTQSIKDKLNYLQWLIDLAKEHDFDFTKSMLFLESELKVPTVAGLPLVLSVDGTATMDLKIKGKVDLRDLVSSPSAFDITGTVRPTAAIQINGKMGVDAFIASTGLKMTNTFFTSTLADGSITLKNGKIFNLDINLPDERQEVFNAQSKFFITYRGSEHEQSMPTEGRFEAHRCVSDSLVSALGVEVCADLSLPRLTRPNGPWFPLTGPVSASISLNKRDSLSKYHMEARVIREEVSKGVTNHELVFNFNTPGSRYDREFTVNLAVNNAEKAVRLDLRSPWKKFDITGNMVNTEELRRLFGQIIIDDAEQYSIVSQLETSAGKYATRYIPLIEMTVPNTAPYKLHGSVIYREGKKADVDISIDNVFEEQATFKGLIRKIAKNDQMRLEADMAVDVMTFKGKMSGFVDSTQTKDELKADTELTLKYRTSRGPQSISLTNQFQMQTPRGRNAIVMTGSLASSLYRRYDTDYSLQLFSEDKEAGLSLSMGLTKDKPTRVTLDLQGKHDIARNYRNALVQGLARLHFLGDEWETKIEHSHSPNELKTILTGRENSDEGVMELSLKRQGTETLNVAAEAKLTYPDHHKSYIHTLVQTDNVFNHDLRITNDGENKFTLTSVYKMGPRHEMSADLEVDGCRPVHAEGFFNSDLKNFAAEAKLASGYNAYSTNVEWQHAGNARNLNNKASWKLDINGDRVGIESDVSIENGNNVKFDVQGNWDINNQGMKKTGITGTCIISKTTPSLQATLQWSPNKFVSTDISLKLDDNDFWSRNRDLEGTMTLSSSYFDDIKTAFKHGRRPDTVSTSGEIAWNRGKKIDGAFNLRKINGYSNAQVTFVLNTPYSQARRINTEATYNLQGQKVTASGRADWDNQVITFETTSVIDLPNVDVSVSGTTPFEGYESYTLVGKHTSAGRNCESELKLDVGSRQLVAVDYNMDHQRNGYFMTNTGSLSVKLPIEGYTTNKLTWNHRNTLRDIDSRIVLELENDKSILDIEAKNRRLFMVKANVISPYIPNIRLKIDHQADRRQYIYKSSGSLQYGRNAVAFDNDLSLLENAFTLKTKVNTPWKNWEEMVLDLSNVQEGNVFTANNRFTCGSGHTYEVSGNFINKGMPAFSSDMKLICPFYGEVLIDASNTKEMNIWVSSINAMLPENDRINIVTKLGLDDLKKVSVDITTPYSAMREVSMDIEHRGEPKQCDTKFKFSHNKISGTIEGELNIDVLNVNDIKIKLTGSTPFEGATSIRSILSHKKSGQVYQSDFSFETPRNKATASNMMRINSGKIFNTETVVEYTTGKKIELELDVNVERNIALRGAFRSPWTGEQTASLNHQGSLDNFQTSLTVSPKQYEVIESKVEFVMRESNINALAKVTSPYQELRTFEVTFNHRGEITSFNSNLMANYNENKMTATLSHEGTLKNFQTTLNVSPRQNENVESKLEFNLRGNNVNALAKVTTPYNVFRLFEVTLNHRGEITSFNSDASISYNEEKMTASLSHEGSWKNFQSSVNISPRQYEVIDGKIEFKLRGDNVNALAKVTTPYRKLRLFEMTLNHRGELTSFNSDVSATYNGEKMTATLSHEGSWKNFQTTLNISPRESENIDSKLEFNLRGNNINGLAKVTTPYRKLRLFEMTLNHRGEITSFESDVAANYNGEKMTATLSHKGTLKNFQTTLNVSPKQNENIDSKLEFNLRGNDVNALAKVTTPYNVFRLFEVTLNHRGGITSFNSDASISYNEEKMTASLSHEGSWNNFQSSVNISPRQYEVIDGKIEFKLRGDNVNALAKVTTPYEMIKIFEITLNHRGEITSCSNDYLINYNGKKITGNNKLDIDSRGIRGESNMNTPFEGYRTMSYSFNHAGDLQVFNGKYEINWESKKIELKMDYNYNYRGVTGSFDLSTPFEQLKTASLSFEHSGEMKDFRNNGRVQYNDNNYSGQSSFQLSGNNLKASATVKIPEEYSFDVNHNGDVMEFTNDATVRIDRQVFKGQSGFKMVGNSIEMNVMAESPIRGFTNMGITFTHRGDVRDFECDLVLKLEDKRITSRQTFKLTEESLDHSVTVQTPFQGYSNMAYTFNAQKSRNGLNSQLTLNKEEDRIEYRSNFRVTRNKITSSMSISTPFRQFKEASYSLFHNGDSSSFNNEITGSWNRQTITGKSAFSTSQNSVEASASVETPFEKFSRASAELKHSGVLRNFNNELTLTLENRSIKNTNVFSLEDDRMAADFKIETPFEGFSTAGIEMKHNGPVTDFNNDITLTLENKSIKNTNIFSVVRNKINGDFKLETPFEAVRLMRVELSHTGRLTRFNNAITLNLNGDEIKSRNTFFMRSNYRIDGGFNIETPFRDFRTMSAIIKHNGEPTDFNCEYSVSLEEKKITLRNNFLLQGSKLECSATLETPFDGYSTMGINLKHNGPVTNWNNELSTNIEQKTIRYESSFKLEGSKADLSASLSTPFRAVRNIILTVDHNGPLTNFRNEGVLQYNGERYTADSEFALRQEFLKLAASVRIPDVYGFVLEHEGPWTGFNNNLLLTIAGNPHTATSSFKYDDKIEGNFNLDTPKFPVTLKFNHEGAPANFKQDSTLNFNGNVYSHNGVYSLIGRKLNANFEVNTPHRVARSLSAKFDHQGKWNNFENLLVLERNGEDVRVSSQFSATEKRVKGDLTIRTPKEYSIAIIQKGPADDMTAIVKLNAGNQKSQANIDFKNKNNVIEGAINVRTPYRGYRNMGAELSYKNKKILSITGKVKTPFDNFETFAVELTHNGDQRQFTTTGKIETPFRRARITQFELNHEGRLRNFAERAFIDVDQQRISGNVAFRNNNAGFLASANIESPFEVIKTASVSLTHNGEPVDFTTTINGEYNNQRMEGTATFKKSDTIQATATLSTPFEAIREAKFKLNHEGNSNVFITSSDVSVNGQEVRGNFNFNKRGTVIESSGSLSTPFEQLREGSFRLNHRGDYSDFVTSGQVEFDRKKIDAELLFKLQPEIMTTARLSTPWTTLRQFNFNLNHRGSFMDFSTIASGELNGDRMNGNVAFKKEGNTIESSATINTPFEVFPEWAYTLTHRMQRDNIRSTATLTLPCQVYKHFRGELNIDGSLDNFNGNVKVNTPFESFPEGILRINHRGEIQDFTTSGSLEYSGQRIETEMNAKNTNSLQQGVLKIKTPYNVLRNMHVEFDNQKRGSDMIGRVAATYNDRKQVDSDYTINFVDMSSAVVSMRRPINMEFNGKNNYNNKEMSFNIPKVISLTSNFEKDSDSFSHSSRLQAGEGNNQIVSYRLEGSATTRSRQLIYDGRFTIDSSFGNFESTMSHKINNRRYITDVQIQRLKVNTDIEFQQAEPNMKVALKLSHPSFPNEDILFAVEGSYRDTYNGKVNLEYADQKFEFVGKLADESPSSSNTRYVAEAHLTHPASYLDVQFTSQLTNDDEKMGGNMEVKYMMTRDRQLKANALRAEINKLKEELNLELNTPVKRVSMTGRRVDQRNGQHFTVEGNIDDRDMRADVQLNNDEPGFDINIQVDRNNQVFVSGKYSEPATLQLEAYREEYGRRVRESEVSVSLNSNNLVRAKAYLNPDFYDDLQRVLGVDLGLEQMMDDVSRSLREEWRYKSEALSRAIEPITSAMGEMTRPFLRAMRNVYNRDAFYIRTVAGHVSMWATSVGDSIAELKYQYRYQLRRAARELESFYRDSVDNMQWFFEKYIVPSSVSAFKKTMEAAEYLRTHPTLSRFLDFLESLDIETHYANFRDYCMKVVNQYNAMLDEIKAYWEEFKDIPGMTYVIDYVKEVIDGIRWVYDVTELDEFVKACMKELRTHGWRAIRMWLQSKMDLVQAEYSRWEPEQGEYEVQVMMPVSWSEVTSIPDFGLSKYWEQLKSTFSHVVPDMNFSFGNSWSFWDAFYTYKPSSNPRDWIPPFNTHAAVAGSQHFMTFDKKFYQFAGECSYLLARDFINGKFSVVINYENSNGIASKKSITVHSGDKEIEIFPDFKVTVDGRQTEMPVVIEKTVIRRIGNLIQVDNEHGLNVTCNLPHNHCSVHVTGWYYGKTGGLLGTYDNEPATDFQKSDRSHATSVEDFSQSWSLGKRCRANNQATQVSMNSASAEYRMCARYFKEESSPFRLCYGQIQPSEFMTMCVNEVSRSNDKVAAVCRITSFYVDQCKMAKVPVRMPRDCVKCSDNNGSPMQEGQTITLENRDVPKAADVVFVISHKSCNRDVLARLGDIVDQMIRNFKQSGVRDVRFGLVGYGLSGTLGGPHSHTFEGEIFNTGSKFTAGLSSFAITNERTSEDSLTALHFAARYPFRMGVSKSIVHVPCDSCTEQEVEYPDIQRLLLDRDVRLHLLLHHNFELRTAARKTAYIFGIDREGLFTPRSVGDEELNGDKALRKQVSVPKDLCAALSQESDGSIFSMTQLLEARTMVQKKFLDVFTRMTAKKGAPTECQICECMADETGVGMSVCRSCIPSEPMNMSWFEYEGSFSEEQEDSSEEFVKKPLTREEKRRRKEQRRLRMLERKNNKKNQ